MILAIAMYQYCPYTAGVFLSYRFPIKLGYYCITSSQSSFSCNMWNLTTNSKIRSYIYTHIYIVSFSTILHCSALMWSFTVLICLLPIGLKSWNRENYISSLYRAHWTTQSWWVIKLQQFSSFKPANESVMQVKCVI